MTRKYDIKLVSEIRNKEFSTIDANGIKIINKPVPDDDRKNILDPRVLEIAKKKRKYTKTLFFHPNIVCVLKEFAQIKLIMISHKHK